MAPLEGGGIWHNMDDMLDAQSSTITIEISASLSVSAFFSLFPYQIWLLPITAVNTAVDVHEKKVRRFTKRQYILNILKDHVTLGTSFKIITFFVPLVNNLSLFHPYFTKSPTMTSREQQQQEKIDTEHTEHTAKYNDPESATSLSVPEK